MFWHWSYSEPWWGWWWFPFHGLLSLIFTIAIVYLIVTMVRGRRPRYPDFNATTFNAPTQALQILEERYARGEIQREEYLQKKQDLRS
ncbi:MAG TPA: SHOCT domain-containing protein [Rhizomicrobium sp.]|jgi:putative membrane protein